MKRFIRSLTGYTISSIVVASAMTITFFVWTLQYAHASERDEHQFKVITPIAVPDDIPIFDKDGEKHYFEEYEGKALLVTFWASWSAPCAEEIVNLDILQKDFRKIAFEVLAVSEDYQDVKVIEGFYKQHGIRYLNILHDYRNQLFKAFAVVGVPTTFVINADGMIVGRFDGIVAWHDDNVRKLLLDHIPGNPAEPKNSYKAPSLNQSVKPINQK